MKTEQDCFRPFLKWVGGKGKLIPQYTKYLPKSFDRYFEPFIGGGALFFYLSNSFQSTKTTYSYISDTNSELINTYICIRDRVEEVIGELTEMKRNHTEEYYYHVRSIFCAEHSLGGVQQAARFIYLNKTCFNGLYRVNSRNQFNVPVGRYKNPDICAEQTLINASRALRETEIKQAHFSSALADATKPGDFVYLDPPYYPITKTSNFTSYSATGFKLEDHLELKYILTELTRRGVQVLLSNSDCDFTRHLFSDFTIYPIFSPRSINSQAAKRGTISEILVANF